MGINTVAVLYNDVAYTLPERMYRAIVDYRNTREDFGSGQVISAAHADYYQVVIVHGNTGWTLTDAPELPLYAQENLAGVLRKHGWKVTKNARKTSKRISSS